MFDWPALWTDFDDMNACMRMCRCFTHICLFRVCFPVMAPEQDVRGSSPSRGICLSLLVLACCPPVLLWRASRQRMHLLPCEHINSTAALGSVAMWTRSRKQTIQHQAWTVCANIVMIQAFKTSLVMDDKHHFEGYTRADGEVFDGGYVVHARLHMSTLNPEYFTRNSASPREEPVYTSQTVWLLLHVTEQYDTQPDSGFISPARLYLLSSIYVFVYACK